MMDAKEPKTASTWRDAVGLFILAGVLVWWGWWASRGWSIPGLGGHEFRQTQTALTIQSMQETGFKVAYETPILGKPWSIPMEFPLYQGAVVGFCAITGKDIVDGGRWVSVLAFLAGLPAFWFLLRGVGLSRGGAALALVPVVLAPVHQFFARTVMIESMAWAASAWFLVGVMRYRRTGDVHGLALALAAGAVAVLVKPTTWSVFCLPWAAVFLRDAWRWRTGAAAATTGRRLVVQAAGIGVPLLLCGFLWVARADAIKAQNPIAHFLLSSELRGFNFGTWEQRTSGESWGEMLGRWRDTVAPAWALVPGLAVALVGRGRRLVALAALLGFVGGPMIFFNLYLKHDYYFFANAAGLAVAAGLGAAVLWERRGRWWQGPLPALCVVVLLAWGQWRTYATTLLPVQVEFMTGDHGLTRAIRRVTDPGDVIVAHSPDWNSSLAFYSGRKMLMIPDAQMFFHPGRVAENLALLADESVPLVLMIRESRVQPDWAAERILQFGLSPNPLFVWEGQVTAYARLDRYSLMQARLAEDLPPGIELDRSQDLLPAEQRRPLAGTEHEATLAAMGLHPEFGVVPFGISVSYPDAGPALLAHAPTELYFRIPAGATAFECDYQMNPDVYAQRDFDGVSVHFELVSPSGAITPLQLDWLSPLNDRGPRRVELKLPPLPDGTLLLFRVLPGPRNSNAYDQAWLRRLVFKP